MIKAAHITAFCALVILTAPAHAEKVAVPLIGNGYWKSCADFVVAAAISIQASLWNNILALTAGDL
jgi:hypothetical protein